MIASSTRIWSQLIQRWESRLGAAWIAFLLFLAVFAPFLANSHPVLVQQKGVISSPLLALLTPADMTLLGGLVTVSLLIFLRRLSLRQRLLIGIVTTFGIGITAYFSVVPPKIIHYDTYRQMEKQGDLQWALWPPIPYSPKDYLRDSENSSLAPPLAEGAHRHWLGTEVNGGDVLSRMIHASRISLGIGLVATGIAIAIGIVLGALMGYYGRWVDMIGMRLVEIFEAIPTIFLLLALIAFFERSLYLMMVIIGLTSWSGYARYIRAEFFRLREQSFVQAAIACGLPTQSILFRHILPNAIAPVLVAASFGVASAILAESTLSFLGLGLVDNPSWGAMLNQAIRSSTLNWWLALFPGGAIFLTVFSYNLVGEVLRDALDPRGG